MQVRNLSVRGDRGSLAVKNLSLAVRAGEIVGIAGVSGNGQRELADAIFGLRRREGGDILIDDEPVMAPTPKSVRARGLTYVPEERMRDGSIGEFTVAENLMLVDYGRPPYTKGGLLQREPIEERCAGLVDRYSVKTPTLETPTRSLSGGNIQKVVIAREFSAGAGVLVVAQPTRGVDIGAAEYIHEQLLLQRREGAAILLISEDLDEVLQMSDRIIVLLEGEVMGEVSGAEADVQKVGLLMTGVTNAG